MSMTVLGTHDENTLAQMREVEKNAVHTALMADGHLGFIMPVGGVAAYYDHVLVAGVGYDIACGNCAIKTDLHLEELYGDSDGERVINVLADDIQSRLSFGVGRKNKSDDAPVDHPLFESDAWLRLGERASYIQARDLKDKARAQLGTVGSGNHYVDVFSDEDGWIWVGVHFGSRGLGHTIASGFMSLGAGKQWGEHAKETDQLLSLQTELGQDYWELMQLCGTYAYAGREWVARQVVKMLGAREVEMVHNHHNFAWKENHPYMRPVDTTPGWKSCDDSPYELVVVRKGATPAFPGQKGFVGGSMGDCAVILQGAELDSDDHGYYWAEMQACSLYSTVHGAGRVMSRTAAAGKVRRYTRFECGQRDCKGTAPFDKNAANANVYSLQGNPKCPECGSKTHKRRGEERISAGLVDPAEMAAWLNRCGVVLRGAGLDEAPQAYRRLPDVLKAQGDTVEVLHTLTPLVVVMAGEDEYDPYKD